MAQHRLPHHVCWVKEKWPQGSSFTSVSLLRSVATSQQYVWLHLEIQIWCKKPCTCWGAHVHLRQRQTGQEQAQTGRLLLYVPLYTVSTTWADMDTSLWVAQTPKLNWLIMQYIKSQETGPSRLLLNRMYSICPAFVLCVWLNFVFTPQFPPLCQTQPTTSRPKRHSTLLLMMCPHHHRHTPTRGSNLHPTPQPHVHILHPKLRQRAPMSPLVGTSPSGTSYQRPRRTRPHSYPHLHLMTGQWGEGLSERSVGLRACETWISQPGDRTLLRAPKIQWWISPNRCSASWPSSCCSPSAWCACSPSPTWSKKRCRPTCRPTSAPSSSSSWSPSPSAAASPSVGVTPGTSWDWWVETPNISERVTQYRLIREGKISHCRYFESYYNWDTIHNYWEWSFFCVTFFFHEKKNQIKTSYTLWYMVYVWLIVQL